MLIKELNQLHTKDALLPMKKDDLSNVDKKKALQYLMFINEKGQYYQGMRMCRWKVATQIYDQGRGKLPHHIA